MDHDLEAAEPALVRELPDGHKDGSGRVVHKDVDRAVDASGLVHHAAAFDGVQEIGDHGGSLTARFADGSDRALQRTGERVAALCEGARHAHDSSPFGGEALGDGFSDAPAGSGDQSYLSVQPSHVVIPPRLIRSRSCER